MVRPHTASSRSAPAMIRFAAGQFADSRPRRHCVVVRLNPGPAFHNELPPETAAASPFHERPCCGRSAAAPYLYYNHAYKFLMCYKRDYNNLFLSRFITCETLNNTAQEFGPSSRRPLPHQAYTRIPGAVVTPKHPSPIGNVGEQGPYRAAERTCKMRDSTVNADDKINLRDQRCGVGKVFSN